jgi:methionine--tRNA ligase beta chain
MSAFVAELLVGECAASNLWRFMRGVSASSIPLKIVPGTKRPSLFVSPTLEVFEPAAILAALVEGSARKTLMGSTPAEVALVVEAVATFPPSGGAAALLALEARALLSSYIAGPRLTAADALALFSVAPTLAALSKDNVAAAHPAAARWLDQIYNEDMAFTKGDCAPPRVSVQSPLPFDFTAAAAAAAAAAAVKVKTTTTTTTTTVPVSSLEVPVPVAASATITSTTTTTGVKVKKEKVAAPPSAAPPEERSALSEMDFGVGIIVEAWPHPDSDKLWCEKISFGDEEAVREIASGIRAYFTHEQMIGSRVVVVRNLKSRKLAGFASNGMVLCATSSDGNTVEFVSPPATAILGERISFEGHAGQAAEPSTFYKNKVRRWWGWRRRRRGGLFWDEIIIK